MIHGKGLDDARYIMANIVGKKRGEYSLYATGTNWGKYTGDVVDLAEPVVGAVAGYGEVGHQDEPDERLQ
jgi:hypothetical protein